jgi:hypothetical protein
MVLLAGIPTQSVDQAAHRQIGIVALPRAQPLQAVHAAAPLSRAVS